jgi:hypothetical protein
MSQATIKDVTTVPRIAHGEAMQVAAVENANFAALLRGVQPGDWAKPTDCTLWDARAVAAHVVGSAAGQASPREFARQVRKGRPLIAEIGGQYWWDGMNQLQIRERARLSTGQLITEWDVASARALRTGSPPSCPASARPASPSANTPAGFALGCGRSDAAAGVGDIVRVSATGTRRGRRECGPTRPMTRRRPGHDRGRAGGSGRTRR